MSTIKHSGINTHVMKEVSQHLNNSVEKSKLLLSQLEKIFTFNSTSPEAYNLKKSFESIVENTHYLFDSHRQINELLIHIQYDEENSVNINKSGSEKHIKDDLEKQIIIVESFYNNLPGIEECESLNLNFLTKVNDYHEAIKDGEIDSDSHEDVDMDSLATSLATIRMNIINDLYKLGKLIQLIYDNLIEYEIQEKEQKNSKYGKFVDKVIQIYCRFVDYCTTYLEKGYKYLKKKMIFF